MALFNSKVVVESIGMKPDGYVWVQAADGKGERVEFRAPPAIAQRFSYGQVITVTIETEAKVL